MQIIEFVRMAVFCFLFFNIVFSDAWAQSNFICTEVFQDSNRVFGIEQVIVVKTRSDASDYLSELKVIPPIYYNNIKFILRYQSLAQMTYNILPKSHHNYWTHQLPLQPGRVYTFVIQGNEIRMAPQRQVAMLSLLSKHILLARGESVSFAGELLLDQEYNVHVSFDSGTYRPKRVHLEAALEFLKMEFPYITFIGHASIEAFSN